MSLTRFPTAGDVISQVALEVGIPAASGDVFSSTDPYYLQLCGLLNTSGRELVELHPWQQLVKTFTITTDPADTGKYDLPDDWGYMIDQTAWARTLRRPMPGPLTPQQWEYLIGRNLNNATIYAQFRQDQGQVWLFPYANGVAPPAGQVYAMEYVGRGWVRPSGWVVGQPLSDVATLAADTLLFDPVVITRLLKLKFLEAKSLPTDAAARDFQRAFDSRTGKDKGGQKLNLNGAAAMQPYYLDPLRNVPETNFGS